MENSISYGHRWIAETAFSSIKRMFGEHATARKFSNMVKEIFLKTALYNMFQSNDLANGLHNLKS